MDFSRELMDHVYDDPNSALSQCSKYLWSTFRYCNHLIGHGCADDHASRDQHAEAVMVQAERFMRPFLLRCLPKHVTMYMHIMQCHCHELIELHGSLDKLSSQGAKAIHEQTRFAALKRSSVHLDSVAEQTFCFVLYPLPVPPKPRHTVGQDYLTHLPMSNGYDSVVIVVDHPTGMAHFLPCTKGVTVHETANLFL
jgi:hypothetical protein